MTLSARLYIREATTGVISMPDGPMPDEFMPDESPKPVKLYFYVRGVS